MLYITHILFQHLQISTKVVLETVHLSFYSSKYHKSKIDLT